MKFFSSLTQALVYLSLTLIVLGSVLYARGYLPDRYNPLAPLDLAERPAAFEKLKIARALSSRASCEAALKTGNVEFVSKDDFVSPENSRCSIKDRVELRSIDGVALKPVETRCQIALRLALWVKWDMEPMAQEELGTSLASIDHFGSYACRAMRGSSRMSKHASADAIDIAGLRFANGQHLTLKNNWNGEGGPFLKEAQERSCDRFRLVLGPEYNALHHDHFHMQETGGWGCR